MTTISACMIVKDAEKHLERCLNSLQGIVDEIIIVDTGSKDTTMEIAQRFGAKIHHFSWIGDFSEARNESLKYATKDWILYVDDDEAFDRRELQQLKSRLEGLDADALIIPKKNFTNKRNIEGWTPSREIEGFEGYFISKRIQMFRNHKEIKFSYRLHETVMPSLKEKRFRIREITDVSLIHYGYGGTRDSYVSLVEKELEEHGNNIKVLYEAGVVFLNKSMYDKAIEAFTKVRKIHPNFMNTLNNLGTAYMKKGKFHDAAQVFLDAIDKNEKNISAYNNLAAIFWKVKNYERAEFLLKRGLQIKKDPRMFYLLALVYKDQDNQDSMEKAIKTGLSYFPQDQQLLELSNKI